MVKNSQNMSKRFLVLRIVFQSLTREKNALQIQIYQKYNFSERQTSNVKKALMPENGAQ